MKHEEDGKDAYLWNGSGEPDPAVVRLERTLGRLRHQGVPPHWPARFTRRPRRLTGLVALAAGLVFVAGVGYMVTSVWRSSWVVQSTGGAPVIDGRAVGSSGQLDVGGTLVTDASSRARLRVTHIGQVDVEPNTRLQLLVARSREHRLSLERGTIHARIWAPPRFFFVNTPAATAIDLGCAYTLQVADDGSGLLRVTHGWVGFERDGRQAYIPQGAVCATRRDVGPGTPRYEDAPSGYAEALAVLDFGAAGALGREAALSHVLDHARRKDALTLWHLLARGSAPERTRTYERLAALVPPPHGASRELVVAGDPAALGLWWDALGVDMGTWWTLLKKKW